MYVHICKKELCPHCLQMSCTCEQKYENTSAGYKMLCPHCHGIMAQTTITTTDTEMQFASKLIESQKDIDPEIAQIVSDHFWELL